MKGGKMAELKFKKVEMTDEDLRDRKLHLAHCKIQKDDTDIALAEMEEQLDKDLANKLLDDDIEKLSKDIEKKERLDQFGNKILASEADLVGMQIALDKFKKQRELDLPSRQLRQNINKLRDAKVRPDAPEKQIKKLEKEIREKAYEIVDNERGAPGIN